MARRRQCGAVAAWPVSVPYARRLPAGLTLDRYELLTGFTQALWKLPGFHWAFTRQRAC